VFRQLVNGARFYPYGDEITSIANDHVKFGTYTRDSYTGLDYADQRFYASSYGRFNSPDPYAGSAGPSNPGSWNRYSYTLGDPVDRNDRKGLDSEDCGAAWVSDASLSGPCTVDGYASIDLSAVMQSACNQLIMAFGPVPVTDPSCAGYAPIVTVAAPAQPQPQCSISLYERPTPLASSPGWHTYLAATNSNGQAETIEGGPAPGLAFVGGTLTGTISPPATPLSGFGSGDATNTALPSNKEVGSPYTGSNACSDIASLNSWVAAYNSGSKVTYNFSAVSGYNSNSFTYTLDSQLGLLSYFGQPGGFWVPGWGKLVPGL